MTKAKDGLPPEGTPRADGVPAPEPTTPEEDAARDEAWANRLGAIEPNDPDAQPKTGEDPDPKSQQRE